jgi:ribose 5-phosphate isomerase A
MSINQGKKAAGIKACEFLKEKMLIGLGTGSTVFYFIDELIKKTREGLEVLAVSSSTKSTSQAKEGGITFGDLNSIKQIDLTIDGADQIDPQGRMIKGGGGALLREKILASCSKEVIIIVDQSKVAKQLGFIKVPVEILPFGVSATIFHIEKLNFQGRLRKKEDGTLFVTDNGSYIYDIDYKKTIESPEEDHLKLKMIPGVIETGFFFNLVKKLIIGYESGVVEIKEF